jgi:hypothetical protein
VENNVQYGGADIRSFRSRGLRDCYNHCRRQRGCVSFTMRKRDRYCWLKKRFNGARKYTNRQQFISANLVITGDITFLIPLNALSWYCRFSGKHYFFKWSYVNLCPNFIELLLETVKFLRYAITLDGHHIFRRLKDDSRKIEISIRLCRKGSIDFLAIQSHIGVIFSKIINDISNDKVRAKII